MKKHGRPKGKGPDAYQATLAVMTMASKLGHEAIKRPHMCHLTLNQFYKQYASKGGVWVVFIKAHAIGFRDGKTLDWTGDATTGEIIRRKTAYLGYRADCACIEIIEGE